MKVIRQWSLVLCGVLIAAGSGLADSGRPVPLEERARGAERVVVATVTDTTARYERNEFGDEIIITRARLAVEEVLKGKPGPVTLAIEGGTVDGITMRVSSLPPLSKGERAVFYLAPGQDDEFRPHLRGQGILKLDPDNRVRGSSLTLDEVRKVTRSAVK